MATLIDGKKISTDIKDEVKIEAAALKEKGIEPCLAVILVGENPASQVYVRNKKRACEYCGIKSLSYELPDTTSEDELLSLIDKLNADPSCHGILVQLPLPKHIDEDKVLLKIDPKKDVDGFHPYNVGLLSIGKAKLKACTPAGCIELIKRSGVDITGKKCVVVGRSNIVGKPVGMLLLAENGTVITTHSKTKDLPAVCREADILVAAIGKPKFITADMVSDGVTVIDVGINRMDDGKLCGDVDFENVEKKAAFITPVPGGVGPMTIAMLMKNCLTACRMQNNLE
ncbi:MAG: bifunctional methylenetetrahydrofolate dehydrogenase/methenyltetrahydrofolate cyclohydrolase FolD [Firmicutes bacterium]|nr:bifunctional methylenetetrahydrofolate dehydrogenase/methenyltetrahydrofolate cyclohydrolase FolD [Bacillota bacterium]